MGQMSVWDCGLFPCQEHTQLITLVSSLHHSLLTLSANLHGTSVSDNTVIAGGACQMKSSPSPAQNAAFYFRYIHQHSSGEVTSQQFPRRIEDIGAAVWFAHTDSEFVNTQLLA